MHLYFFHVKTGDTLQRDEMGIRCDSDEAAYAHAYEAIPELAAELLRDGFDPMACALLIEDEAHRPVFSIPFTARLKADPRPD